VLLAKAQRLDFDPDGGHSDDDDEASGPVKPIVVTSPAGPLEIGERRIRLVLDWWSDRSIKPWAGSMKEGLILNAMLRAIDPASPDPFNESGVVPDPISGKKREPFYFDCRRGCNAHPLDSGFSPDTQEMESECCPAVEAMCFIGLQRARPAPADVPNRSVYVVWSAPLPVNALAPVVCGAISLAGSSAFAFDNFFRTDQRKHKCYSRATRERSKDV
jgi:CRISPR-associated protein Csb3